MSEPMTPPLLPIPETAEPTARDDRSPFPGVRKTAWGYKARGIRGLFDDPRDAYDAFVAAQAVEEIRRREDRDDLEGAT